MKYTIHYWDVRGRGELCRLLLAASGLKEGQDWLDKRVSHDCYISGKWAQEKLKYPFHALPALELEDGRLIGESLVIGRYLANEFGLAGETSEERVEADEIATASRWILDRLIRIFWDEKDPEKVAALKKELRFERIPMIFTNLEARLKQRKSPFFLGDRMTWADIVFFDATHLVFKKHEPLKTEFPLLSELAKRVEGHPSLKAYTSAHPYSLLDNEIEKSSD